MAEGLSKEMRALLRRRVEQAHQEAASHVPPMLAETLAALLDHIDSLTAERDRLREVLEDVHAYVLHLQRDVVDDEDRHLEDGEPYHGDNCSTCRETRLLRKIGAALSEEQGNE